MGNTTEKSKRVRIMKGRSPLHTQIISPMVENLTDSCYLNVIFESSRLYVV
jgi:hypothetical protein